MGLVLRRSHMRVVLGVPGQAVLEDVEALELLERAPEKATVVTAAIEGKELPGGAQQVAAS